MTIKEDKEETEKVMSFRINTELQQQFRRLVYSNKRRIKDVIEEVMKQYIDNNNKK